MDGISDKDESIISIVNSIEQLTGENYFQPPDFWDGDLCAIGLHRHDKLVYISTWQVKDSTESDPKYWVEFELIDGVGFDTLQTVKTFDGIDKLQLLEEIKLFFGLR